MQFSQLFQAYENDIYIKKLRVSLQQKLDYSFNDLSAIHMHTFTYLCKFYLYVNFTRVCKNVHVNANTYNRITVHWILRHTEKSKIRGVGITINC